MRLLSNSLTDAGQEWHVWDLSVTLESSKLNIYILKNKVADHHQAFVIPAFHANTMSAICQDMSVY